MSTHETDTPQGSDEFGEEFRDTALHDREHLDAAFAEVEEPDSEVELTKGGSSADDRADEESDTSEESDDSDEERG